MAGSVNLAIAGLLTVSWIFPSSSISGTSGPFWTATSGVETSVSTMAISAVSPGASPRGFETVAPCGAAMAVAAAGAVVCGAPSGLPTVAPCIEALSEGLSEIEPSGFATVAPCAAGGVDFAPLSVTIVPAGLADASGEVGAGTAETGAVTVAERTLAVMFGDPAELGVEDDAATGVEFDGTGALVAVAVTGGVATAAVFSGTTGVFAAAGVGVVVP